VNKEPQYTNLEVHVNFVGYMSQDIIRDIAAVLKKHGYEEFSQEMGTDESGTYFLDKVVFFPKECC
jgi:hypothetical protein